MARICECGLYLPPVLIFLYNYGSKCILCEIYTEKDHPFIFCKVHNYSQRKVGTCIDNYVHHGLAKKFKILFTFIFFILILGRHFNMCSGMINKCPFYAKVFPPNITKSLLKYKIDLKWNIHLLFLNIISITCYFAASKCYWYINSLSVLLLTLYLSLNDMKNFGE